MASIEAEDIGETMYRPSSFPGARLPAVAADEALDAIGRTGANITYPSALFRNDGVALDPQTGNTLAVQGPEYVTPNTDAGSALNAPMTSRAFMVQKQPGYREGGRSFGDYPQVDVTGTTTLFANRLRGQEGFNNISTNIRSVDELQRVTDMMVARGGKFSTKEMDPTTGKLKSVRQPNQTFAVSLIDCVTRLWKKHNWLTLCINWKLLKYWHQPARQAAVLHSDRTLWFRTYSVWGTLVVHKSSSTLQRLLTLAMVGWVAKIRPGQQIES